MDYISSGRNRTRREEGSPRHVIAVACPMVPTFRVRRPLCAKLRNKGEICRGPEITHPLKGRRKLQNGIMAGVHEAPYRLQFLRAGRRRRKILRAKLFYVDYIYGDRWLILHASLATHKCLTVWRWTVDYIECDRSFKKSSIFELQKFLITSNRKTSK